MNPETVYWAESVPMKFVEHDELFKRLWWRAESIPGSFTRLNAAMLYKYAIEVPKGGMIVEIGVDQGRSGSILLGVAEATGANLIFIDSWESLLINNFYKFNKLREEYRAMSVVLKMPSLQAHSHLEFELKDPFSMIHIDADHHGEHPGQDCRLWLPMLKPGGIACFHDYGFTFPAVTEAVDEYTKDWEDLGSWDSLAIRRKPVEE